ncbi:MAG: Holliday junction resolvase RecU [Methanomicrobia archaeon]|nr:Holliday junction resolvase RecU [Methanomicrobia archaeon]MCK4636919.1 Holliday junction resolvase RecU [Methanomicrobia archaeon]
MTTNITETEMKNSLKHLMEKNKIYFMKYPDSVREFYKSPYDFLVLTEKYNYAIEVKKIKTKSFPFKNITDHQIESLFMFSNLLKRNRSFVLINYRNGKRKVNEKINEAYIIDILDFINIKESTEKKSLPMEWCEHNAISLKRMRFEKGYGWDLSLLLESDLVS